MSDLGADQAVGPSGDRWPVALVTTRPDGTMVGCNDAFRRRLGRPDEDDDGVARLQDLMTVGTQMYYETHVAPMLLMNGEVDEIAMEFVAADGDRVHTLINAALVRDGDERPELVHWALFVAESRRHYEHELLAAKARAERSEQEANVLAEVLQQALIPAAPPRVAGLDIGARYRPAGNGRQIGGDFYDVFQIAADVWMIAIGDVQGKGAAAAVITSLARYTIRSAAVEHERPSDVLRVLNTVLRHDPTDRLCTALVLRLRRVRTGWNVRISCAGHAPALLRTAAGTTSELGELGSLLGFFDDPSLHDVDVDLGSGDTLVAYTDGVSEARRGQDWYGDLRVRDILDASWASATELADLVVDDVLRFEANAPRDDIAVVAVGVT